MNAQNTPHEVRFPITRMGAAAILACVLGAFAGGALGTTQGASMNDGMMTLIATIPSVGLSILVLGFLPPRIPGAWGIPVLGVSMARSLLALAIGLMVYLFLDPSKFVFFLSLLGVLLIVLIIEVAAVMSMVHEQSPKGVAAEGV